ncbi:MAG: flippase, partial [Longimicrobiales bacterium]
MSPPAGLARNITFNLIGHAAPLVAAVVAIPILIDGLGTEAFGLLGLVWLLIGYFGLFDLGLGRAVTHLVARAIGQRDRAAIPEIVWTATLAALAVGCGGALLVYGAADALVTSLLDVSAALEEQAAAAFRVLALSLPFVIWTALLRGVLEAEQRFDLVNALRVPAAVFSYVGPLVVLPFTDSIVAVVTVLLVGRVLAWVAHLWLCVTTLEAPRSRPRLSVARLRSLLRFGGWTTVSNVVSPIMAHLDRFLIGALVSVAAVAYYVTPYEVVTRLGIVPAGVMGVIFPAIAGTFSSARAEAPRLLDLAMKLILLGVFPLVLPLVAFAPEILDLWLGPDFAARSTLVLRLLAVGVLLNSMAQALFGFVQAFDRPDLTAKLHLVELPLYVALVWWLTLRLGIAGAALAWTLRVALDTAALTYAARALEPKARHALARAAGLT